MTRSLRYSYELPQLHRLVVYFVVCFSICCAMEHGERVLVRRTPQKDWWKPSLTTAGDDVDESPRPLKVTFSGPATHWTDAIPIGNGRLGAMVWGGVPSEVLQLNGIYSTRTCCFQL